MLKYAILHTCSTTKTKNMKPKEKAKELVDKFEKEIFDRFTTDEDYVKCIYCALICVDEILNALQRIPDLQVAGNHLLDQIIYWVSVKEQLEKL